MDTETPRSKSRILDFASIEEEAEFWDTHDFTDYFEESRPVELRVSPDLQSVFRTPVYLDLPDREDLERQAKNQGIKTEELAAR